MTAADEHAELTTWRAEMRESFGAYTDTRAAEVSFKAAIEEALDIRRDVFKLQMSGRRRPRCCAEHWRLWDQVIASLQDEDS